MSHAGAERVPLVALDMHELEQRVQVRTEAMLKSKHLSYGASSEAMNRVGLLGEFAARSYLDVSLLGVAHGVSDISERKPSRGASYGDVGVSLLDDAGLRREVGLEVKTSRYRDWKRIGRVLNEHQLGRTTAVAIIWCVVGNDPALTESVVLTGWLPTDEVRHAPSNERVVLSGQACVRVHDALRPPSEMAEWLRAMPIPQW